MNGKYEKIKDAVFSVLGKKRAFVSAVILAGGSGARMGPGEPKQMRLLCGKPLIAHTLLAFERCEYVDEIVLGRARRRDRAAMRKCAPSMAFPSWQGRWRAVKRVNSRKTRL